MNSDNNGKLLSSAVLSDIQRALLYCRVARVCPIVFLIRLLLMQRRLWSTVGMILACLLMLFQDNNGCIFSDNKMKNPFILWQKVLML